MSIYAAGCAFRFDRARRRVRRRSATSSAATSCLSRPWAALVLGRRCVTPYNLRFDNLLMHFCGGASRAANKYSSNTSLPAKFVSGGKLSRIHSPVTPGSSSDYVISSCRPPEFSQIWPIMAECGNLTQNSAFELVLALSRSASCRAGVDVRLFGCRLRRPSWESGLTEHKHELR